MRSIESIKDDIRELQSRLSPLQCSMESLRQELREAESLEFIRANKITLDDVETMDGDDKPYFTHAQKFLVWLARHSTKRFCEWNGLIYHRLEFISGECPLDSPGRLADLVKLEEVKSNA